MDFVAASRRELESLEPEDLVLRVLMDLEWFLGTGRQSYQSVLTETHNLYSIAYDKFSSLASGETRRSLVAMAKGLKLDRLDAVPLYNELEELLPRLRVGQETNIYPRNER